MQSSIKEMYEKLNFENIEFLGNVSYEELAEIVCDSDIALGIFGDTDKAKRVIPNKVFEAIASRVPVITGESDAVKELLFNGESILFCQMHNGEDLAEKILKLINDNGLRENISRNSYELFIGSLTPKEITKNLF